MNDVPSAEEIGREADYAPCSAVVNRPVLRFVWPQRTAYGMELSLDTMTLPNPCCRRYSRARRSCSLDDLSGPRITCAIGRFLVPDIPAMMCATRFPARPG